jgi:hypothetical protein
MSRAPLAWSRLLVEELVIYLEGLIADFAIRMKLNRFGHETLLDAHRVLIEKINRMREP